MTIDEALSGVLVALAQDEPNAKGTFRALYLKGAVQLIEQAQQEIRIGKCGALRLPTGFDSDAWRAKVNLTTTAEELEEFLQANPPPEDAHADNLFALDHFGVVHRSKAFESGPQ